MILPFSGIITQIMVAGKGIYHEEQFPRVKRPRSKPESREERKQRKYRYLYQVSIYPSHHYFQYLIKFRTKILLPLNPFFRCGLVMVMLFHNQLQRNMCIKSMNPVHNSLYRNFKKYSHVEIIWHY